MIVRTSLIYNIDFIVCTDRARICLRMSSQKEKNVVNEFWKML